MTVKQGIHNINDGGEMSGEGDVKEQTWLPSVKYL